MTLAPFKRKEKNPIRKRENTYRQVYDLDIQSPKEMIEGICSCELKNIIWLLIKWGTIFIIKLRRTLSLAFPIQTKLSRVLRKEFFLEAFQGIFIGPIIDVDLKDHLLSTSFSSNLESSLLLAQFSQKRGSRIVPQGTVSFIP